MTTNNINVRYKYKEYRYDIIWYNIIINWLLKIKLDISLLRAKKKKNK